MYCKHFYGGNGIVGAQVHLPIFNCQLKRLSVWTIGKTLSPGRAVKKKHDLKP